MDINGVMNAIKNVDSVKDFTQLLSDATGVANYGKVVTDASSAFIDQHQENNSTLNKTITYLTTDRFDAAKDAIEEYDSATLAGLKKGAKTLKREVLGEDKALTLGGGFIKTTFKNIVEAAKKWF